MSLSRFDFIPKVEVSPPLYFFIIFITCIFPIIAVFLHGLPSRGSTESLAGYRKIGLRVPSNLKDEYKIKYLKGRPPGKSKDGANNWSVKSLWIYPVKSCKGVELFRGSVVATGMLYDRQFSFAQLKPSSNGSINGAAPHMPSRRWEFITQRQYPLLARVTTEVWVPDISLPNLSPKSAQSGGFLIVKFPYQENAWRRILRRIGTALGVMKSEMHFKVPFNPTEKQIESAGYQTEVMTIWKDAPQSLNMSVHVPPELSHFLGISNALGLFRVAPGQERTVFRCAPRKEEMGWQPVTGFADAVCMAITSVTTGSNNVQYPLHLINLASVRDVGRRVVEDIPQLSALRFRPNIISTDSLYFLL